MQKMDTKKSKITDEELAPYENLFNTAIQALEKKKPKEDVVKDLANELLVREFPEERICSAIIKKLNIVNLDTGRKYANDDFVRRLLGPSMKRGTVKKDAQPKKKPLKQGINEAINEEIKIAKEKGITAIEINKQEEEQTRGLDATTYGAETEIELNMDDDSEVIVDAHPTVAAVDTKKTKALEAEIISLKTDLDDTAQKLNSVSSALSEKKEELVALQKDYEKLLQKYNKVAKPYLERRWVTVQTPEGPAIVEMDCVAIPETRRINVPENTQNKNFARSIGLEEKAQHKDEWNKLTKGRRSIDIKIRSDTKAEAS